MMSGHRHYRKPDPLVLLVAAVALGALMTSVVNAGEGPATAGPGAGTGLSSGLIGTDLGTKGARLQVSLTPPPEVEASFLGSGASERELNGLSDIFLSLRYPW
jgi:hypothetical protein